MLSSAVVSPTISELPSAVCSVSVYHSPTNHSVVKPDSGKAMMVEVLNAKSGSRITGA